MPIREPTKTPAPASVLFATPAVGRMRQPCEKLHQKFDLRMTEITQQGIPMRDDAGQQGFDKGQALGREA